MFVNEVINGASAVEYLGLIKKLFATGTHIDSPITTLQKVYKGDFSLMGTKEGGIPVAYVVVEAHEDELVVLQCFSKKREATKCLQKFLEKKAFDAGFDSLVMYTERCPKAWERAYGFKLASYVMRKELING